MTSAKGGVMKEYQGVITEHRRIAHKTYLVRLSVDNAPYFKAGQFIELSVEGFYLRRPISICDADETSITLIYKVFGAGTDVLSHMGQGTACRFLAPLGNGFDLEAAAKQTNCVLVGGGVGVPPLYLLAKRLIDLGMYPRVVLGFNSAEEAFFAEEFADLGLEVSMCTVDGSRGQKGFVTEAIAPDDYVLSCGPLSMLKALTNSTKSGQYSLEARMGCGFGACMGCSIPTRSGSRQVCVDGPVFSSEELIW